MPQQNPNNPEPMNGPRYAVHPGYVTSMSDGDRHFIDAMHLVSLYGLRTGEYIVIQEGLPFGQQISDTDSIIHLYPQRNREDYGHAANIIEARRRGSRLDIPPMYGARPPERRQHRLGPTPPPPTPEAIAAVTTDAARRANESLGIPGSLLTQDSNYSSAHADAMSFSNLFGRGDVPRAEFIRRLEAAVEQQHQPYITEADLRRLRSHSQVTPAEPNVQRLPVGYTLPRTFVNAEQRIIAHVEANTDRVIWVLTYPPGESRQGSRVVSNSQLAITILAGLMDRETEHGIALPVGWTLNRLGPEPVKRRKITRGKRTVVRRRIQSTGEL